MMPITPRDRLGFQTVLRDTRVFGRTVTLLVPTLTICPTAGCGYDALHDSGVNPSCAVCEGLGRLVAQWVTYRIFANIREVDEGLIAARQQPPGSVMGQTFLTVGLRDYPVVLAGLNNKDSYLAVDASTFRPDSLQTAGVGQAEEYVVLLKTFTPIFRATGY